MNLGDFRNKLGLRLEQRIILFLGPVRHVVRPSFEGVLVVCVDVPDPQFISHPQLEALLTLLLRLVVLAELCSPLPEPTTIRLRGRIERVCVGGKRYNSSDKSHLKLINYKVWHPIIPF